MAGLPRFPIKRQRVKGDDHLAELVERCVVCSDPNGSPVTWLPGAPALCRTCRRRYAIGGLLDTIVGDFLR